MRPVGETGERGNLETTWKNSRARRSFTFVKSRTSTGRIELHSFSIVLHRLAPPDQLVTRWSWVPCRAV